MSALAVTRIEPSGELKTFSFIAAGGANQDQQNIAAGPVILAGYEIFSTQAAIRYVKFYNKLNPTSADTPVRRVAVPGNAAGAGVVRNNSIGVLHATELAIRITTGFADNDTAAATAGDVIVNIDYYDGVFAMNGSMGVLVTDHGTHSPEKWAFATADHLVHVKPDAPTDVQIAARKLEIAIVDALLPHHAKVRDGEKNALAINGDGHFAAEIDPLPHVGDALASVVAAAKGTIFESHFSNPTVQGVIRSVLATHFATSMHVERLYHADHHPDHPAAQAFKRLHHPGAGA